MVVEILRIGNTKKKQFITYLKTHIYISGSLCSRIIIFDYGSILIKCSQIYFVM